MYLIRARLVIPVATGIRHGLDPLQLMCCFNPVHFNLFHFNPASPKGVNGNGIHLVEHEWLTFQLCEAGYGGALVRGCSYVDCSAEPKCNFFC
jgi:hypothetical protein